MGESEKPDLRIVELRADSVMRLEAVAIRPDRSPVVILQGDNGAGKSSVIAAIAMALGGKEQQPPRPVHEGAEEAQVIVDLGEMKVTRRWKGDKSVLEIRSPDGLRHTSPQSVLDALAGRIWFDPMAFLRDDPKRQVDTLRRLVGLDFRALDGQRGMSYEARAEANRVLKTLEARLTAAAPVANAPEEPISTDALFEESRQLRAVKASNDTVRATADRLEALAASASDALVAANDRVESARQVLAEAEKRLDRATQAETDANAKAVEARTAANTLVDPDEEAVSRRIAEAIRINELVRWNRERDGIAHEAADARAAVHALTQEIEAVDVAKRTALAEAPFPVEGLSFTEDGVLFRGLPLEQASGAERIRIGVAVGAALAGRLKVMLVREGSLLDDKSLALLAQEAEARGMQIWLETAHRRDGGGFVVEIADGRVVARDGAA